VTLKKLENIEKTDERATQQENPNDNSVRVILLKRKVKYDVQKQFEMVSRSIFCNVSLMTLDYVHYV